MAERIGIDVRMWRHPGIGRYIRELLDAIFRAKSPYAYRLLVDPRDELVVRFCAPQAEFERARSPIYGPAEQIELTRFSAKVELLHVPHFNAPFFCRAKLVATVHDLIYLKEARTGGSAIRKLYVKALLAGIEKNADAVIAVSDFTRRDLESAFPRLTGRVRVIHEAASACFHANGKPDQRTRKKFGLKNDFILFVGSLKAHKNLPVVLDAFEFLRRRKKMSPELVIVGKKDPKESALLERLDRSGAFVRYLGEQTDLELAGLYRAAKALVVPSLWEGFGLTAVEAMACGTPVVASDRASLPEVVGDAGLLFDPTQPEQLEKHLYNLLVDNTLRASLARKGLERAKSFSWENAARQTLGLYEKVLSL